MESLGNHPEHIGIDQIKKLTADFYVPFGQVKRDILWPGDERLENDPEHSFHLAFVGMAIGERLGLDPEKIAIYAIAHDAKEVISGDTSLLDFEGRKTKDEREAQALELLEIDLSDTPFIVQTIKEYEAQENEESRFVYALDKLLATVMVVLDGGGVWKQHGFTFEAYRELVYPIQCSKMGAHPEVLRIFNELWDEVVSRKTELFVQSGTRVFIC